MEDIDTPALVIDIPKVERNIQKAQKYADEYGLRLRPHIKTHKITRIARSQLEAGAHGINCQKLSEAEAMVHDLLKEGIRPDVLLTFNIWGERKLRRLMALAEKVPLTTVADSIETMDGYARSANDAGLILDVMIECDTGGLRCGVYHPEQAVELAKEILKHPSSLRFAGLMTYPPEADPEKLSSWLCKAMDLLKEAGIDVPAVSIGGTPDFRYVHAIPTVTEARPGTYVYMDRHQIKAGAATLDDCAQTVLSTVVSRPTPLRAVCDAGSKALTMDLVGMEGHGVILGWPKARISRISEEHGVIEADTPEDLPPIGTRIHIVPNHACPVSNLFDFAYLQADGQLIGTAPIVARGCVV